MSFWQKSEKVSRQVLVFFLLWIFCWGFWIFLAIRYNIVSLSAGNFSSQSGNTLSAESIFASQKIQKVYKTLENHYYEFEKKPQNEIETALAKSMVSSLGDKHSEFFNEREAHEFSEELSGDFEGIGAVIGTHELGVKIERIIPDSPAERAGLEEGNIIKSGNGIEFVGKTTAEAVKDIRWPQWTEVILVVIQNGEEKTIPVIRGAVNIPSVDGKMIEGIPLWHIQINTFGEKTPLEFINKITELKEQGAKGLILDFRFNGGGYLDSAVTMLSAFLPQNTPVVKVKENNPIHNKTLYTNVFSRPDAHIPLIILVNEFSASASEIVAGALQDYDRALIIGEKTYGKGSVQEMFPLWDGSMMKITVARWYTPEERNIDEEWINPDLRVTLKDEDYEQKFDRQLETAKKVLQAQIEHPQSFEDWKSSLTSFQ